LAIAFLSFAEGLEVLLEQVCAPLQPQLLLRVVLGSCADFSFLSCAMRWLLPNIARLGAVIILPLFAPQIVHCAGADDALIFPHASKSPQVSHR
jgi:hypothetical protein